MAKEQDYKLETIFTFNFSCKLIVCSWENTFNAFIFHICYLGILFTVHYCFDL